MSSETVEASISEERILEALIAIKNGDFTKRLPEGEGIAGQIAQNLNSLNDQMAAIASESNRVSREIGTEGRFGCQAEVQGLTGDWAEMVGSLNLMARRLTDQVRNVSKVTHAVANGDLSNRITVEANGEMGQLKTMINAMVDQLILYNSEIDRIAREIGVEGRFGGQAEVVGVNGCWADLVDNVNVMSANLTIQVRDLSQTTHALAAGNTSRKVTVPAAGETAELAAAINTLVDRHSGARA